MDLSELEMLNLLHVETPNLVHPVICAAHILNIKKASLEVMNHRMPLLVGEEALNAWVYFSKLT